ncbi:MAG: ribonuclease III [Candidatus Eremiobacteraeota bacterium]|nr:ribonuclease III [Candidatus Eremiobacteraeota bacterium]
MSGENYRRRLRALLRLAGVRRALDLSRFERAFVHQSYAREHGGDSNDRMEFLGDSVLGCITAAWLFERFPGEPEGVLTLRKAAIVNDAALAQTARKLGFGALARLGAGMRAAGGADNTTVLADAFEAFVGALFLRFGLEKATQFVISAHVEQLDHSSDALLDAKTRLQHFAQEHHAATPTYREISRGTPQHPAFKSRVTVNGKILGRGEGSSKKAAQQAAAQAALDSIAGERRSVPRSGTPSVARSATRSKGDPSGDSPLGGAEPSLRGDVSKAKSERRSVPRSGTRSK